MDKIGLIAGNGRFPFLVAEQIKKLGTELVIIALKEEADPGIEAFSDKTYWVNLGQLSTLIENLKKESVTQAIMAGQVKHKQLFAGLKLDLRAIKLLASLVNKKTDSILGAVVNELAKEGITLLPSHKYLTHLLPQKGMVSGKKLSGAENADVEFGHKIAKNIAGMDIGQSVVIKDKCVLAVESIEGTDECIRRAAKYGGDGVVVVKVAKPNQDLRFDIPVIGPGTIETMAEVKAGVLAIEAGSTLMLDKENLLELALKSSIKVVAI
jgi:DUF1009 family protein